MFALNRLRTAYVNSPPWLRNVVSPILARVPERLRFGSTYQIYRDHILRSRNDLEFIRDWQIKNFRNVLRTAVLHSTHYKALADKIGLDSSEIENLQLSDINKFPVLTKEELRTKVAEFLTKPANLLDVVSTSGSTGVPLVFYMEKDRSTKEWAFLLDSWSRIGYKPKYVRAVFRGFQLSNVDRTPWEFEPALSELRLSPFHLTNDWMDSFCNLIQRYRVRYLHGYPSALTIFAGHILRNRRRDVAAQIEGVIAASEALFPHQRAVIAQAFETDQVLSFYGQSEKVLFGSDMPGEPNVFEMEPLYGIPEIVNDEGEALTERGAKGRLIGTSLLFLGMPLVRYDTGDTAEIVEPASESNLFRMKVRNITSRRGQEFLVGADGRLISMTAINIHSPLYGIMSSFQFYQDKPGKATLKAVLLPKYQREDLANFIVEISKKVGESVVFDIEVVDDIPKNTRGKFKFIDQKLDIDSGVCS